MKMDTLTSETLKSIIAADGYPCVSIYMPARPDTPTGDENRTRFKTLVRQSSRMAEETTNNDEDLLEQLFAPAKKLLADAEYWRQQGHGLAHFASPLGAQTFRLPLAFEELALCGPRFHIKPLLPLFSDDGHFYILALSLNQVRLFKCTRHASQAVELSDAPESLEESMRFDDPEKQLQFHTGDSRPQGDRPAVHHGQGVGHDDKSARVEEYLRKVDAAVTRNLEDDRAPVVAACTENIFGMLSGLTRLKNLVQEPLRGNPDEMSEDELRGKAWELAEPQFRHMRDQALARFHDRKGTGLASSMLEEVVPAAMHGRVATLFVPLGTRLWGEFDQASGRMRVHEDMRPASHDLLDLAAAQTLAQGGQVYAMNPQDIPGSSQKAMAAAIFRY